MALAMTVEPHECACFQHALEDRDRAVATYCAVVKDPHCSDITTKQM